MAIKRLYSMPQLIKQLLVTINMFEGSDEAHMGRIVTDLRQSHLTLKNDIGVHPDYQDNAGLRKLDKAYKAAGWDNNGLRWHCEKGDEDMGEDIFIVEFTNDKHTTWKLT